MGTLKPEEFKFRKPIELSQLNWPQLGKNMEDVMAKELRNVAAWLGLAALILSALALYVYIDHTASRMGQTDSPSASGFVVAGQMSGKQADKEPFCSCTYGEYDLVCSNVKLGDACSCRDNGARMKLDGVVGYCLDGRVVKEDAYKKDSADPKFEYTQCPDPRNKGK